MPLARETPENHYKQSRRPGQAENTRNEKHKQSASKSTGSTWPLPKIVVVFGTVLLFLGASAGIALYFTASSESKDQRCNVENSTAMDVFYCNALNCKFDVSTCDFSCPLGFVSNPKDLCPISCECADSGIFQGDIQFSEENVPRMLEDYGLMEPGEPQVSLFSASNFYNDIVRWPADSSGRVKIYYFFGPKTNPSYHTMLSKVAEYFSQKTCIDLVAKTKDTIPAGHIGLKIVNEPGCSSYAGVKTKAVDFAQKLTLSQAGCVAMPVVSHEFIHALGWTHMHNRNDRDNYFEFLEENCQPNYRYAFRKMKASETQDLGKEYDKKSVMQYDGWSFAIGANTNARHNGATLIERSSGEAFRKDHRTVTSQEDINTIRQVYCGKPSLQSNSQIVSRLTVILPGFLNF